jgi:hypothetical protein
MPTQLPLTCQQRWVLSLQQSHSDWKCVVAYGFRLSGTLDVALLHRSLEDLIRRHGSLRTRIVTVDGIVKQQIDELDAYTLECVQVIGESEAEIAANAQRFFQQCADSKPDLAADPLLSIKLLKLAERRHWLLLTVHRLIADCFSVDQMMPELWAHYADHFQGRPSSLPARPAQYYDYAIWQQTNSGEWTRRHQTYWNKRLFGARNIQWPADESVPSVPRGVLGRMNTLLGDDLSDALRDFARRERALAAAVMLSVYVALVWRCCHQRDFILPFFVAGRQSEHKAVVGYFSHILYLRIELTGNETFREVLARVGGELFRALTHQDFGRMATEAPRLLEGTFVQWITWHPEGAVSLPAGTASSPADLTVERMSLADFAENLTAIPPGMVDMEMSFFDTDRGIYASGVYRADRFTPGTMERLMSELKLTTEQLVQNPDAPIAITR